MKNLYLIDGMSLVFRAYHALSGTRFRSPAGEPTAAVFGFTNIITSLLEKESPDYIAVAFDRKEPTFRHLMYPLYKANRDAFPEDLVPQLARIKELLNYLSVPQIEIPTYEADDLIGSLAKDAENEGFNVSIITSDKDYYQLVSEKVRLLKPTKQAKEDFEIVDIEGVAKKFGVKPEQVIDVLALIGDSSDNIPGVKGIGDKTAIPLIQQYGTLEGIYENIDKIDKAAVKNNLINDKEKAFLAKTLVTIERNVPYETKIEDFKLKEPDYSQLDKFFSELGFVGIRTHWKNKAVEKSLIPVKAAEEAPKSDFQTSLFGTAAETSVAFSLNNSALQYFLITENNSFDKMIEELYACKMIAVDIETSSLDKMNCEVVGMSLCGIESKAYYIPYPIKNEYFFNKLKELLAAPQIEKCGQNIKFDAFILKRFGIEISPITFDTMLGAYLLNPDNQHNLDALSKEWLNYTPIPISVLIGEKKSQQISMSQVEPEKIKDYACEDADLALKLTNVISKQLEQEKLDKIAREIEFPLIPVLIEMEMNGVAIDKYMLFEISKDITRQARQLTESIFEEAGEEFNIDSPKQIASILFEKMQLPALKKTKTGYSTDVEVLTQLAVSYPIAHYILDYRQLMKLKSTYIDALPKLINSKTGRIHTTFNQAITSTGRLTSTEPNLQNIPIRSDLGKEIRKAFVAQDKDAVILSADYSQIELRIMAYYCQDKVLVEAFKNNLDIHSATAASLFDIEIDKVESNQRRVAKTVNFGIMYGLGSFGLAQRLGIGRKESQEIINNYFKKYPGIKNYIEETIKKTEKLGYAETLFGRRRFFNDINSRNHNLKQAAERAAINMPIQGTAADMMKVAMCKVFGAVKKAGLKSKIILQVHDELVFEAYKNETEQLQSIVKSEMESAMSLGEVPVIAEIGSGPNWFEAH